MSVEEINIFVTNEFADFFDIDLGEADKEKAMLLELEAERNRR